MTLCNINKYVSKNYLNVFKIVLDKIGSVKPFNRSSFAFSGVLICDVFTYFHSHNLGLKQLISV